MRCIKVKFSLYPGIMFGIAFPWTRYEDMVICILCISIHFKWRKK